MYCTHCHKEFVHLETANRWPLINSMATSAHALWPRTNALTIPTHATRLLENYAPLWHAHQPIRDLLTNLSRHTNTPACAPEGTRANEGYEINFYSAPELVGVCKTVIQTLSQIQRSDDLQSSFVICLKWDGAAIYCLSDFLGAENNSNNPPVVGTMYANPLAEPARHPNAMIQESSTDDDADYRAVMPAAASAQPVVNRDWSGYAGQKSAPTAIAWHNYETTLSAQAPNVQTQESYYSVPMEQRSLNAGRGLFEELALKYEQFIVVFAHQSAHISEDGYSALLRMESRRLPAALAYFQQAKRVLWDTTRRRITTVAVTSIIIGGIIGAYLGLTNTAGSSSASSHDRNCTYANGVNTSFAELQETLATGNSSLSIPGLDPATCTLISMVINNTVSALKMGGYNCWQNVQSALMPLAASALALNSDSIQQIIASVKGYCFPSTSTTTPTTTSTTTSSTLTCCQLNVCLSPVAFLGCSCGEWGYATYTPGNLGVTCSCLLCRTC